MTDRRSAALIFLLFLSGVCSWQDAGEQLQLENFFLVDEPTKNVKHRETFLEVDVASETTTSSGSGSGDPEPTGSGESTTAPPTASSTAAPTTTPAAGTTYDADVTANLAVEYVVIDGEPQYWDENLTDTGTDLYKSTSEIFKTQIEAIYTEASLPYSEVVISSLEQPSGAFIRAGGGIQANYLTKLEGLSSAADVETIQSELESAIKSLSDSGAFDDAFGSTPSSEVLEVDNTAVPPDPSCRWAGCLSDGEIAAVIVCSILGGLMLIVLVGYLIFRMTRKPDDVERQNSSSSSSSSSSSGSRFKVVETGKVADPLIQENIPMAEAPHLYAAAPHAAAVPMDNPPMQRASELSEVSVTAETKSSLPRAQTYQIAQDDSDEFSEEF